MKFPRSFWLSILILFFIISIADSAENITLDAPDGTTVTIDRDSYGVPHITAETEVGVFFGQGFAVAQDRMFQMEFFRRVAEGKLSKWMGPLSMDSDREMRATLYTQSEREAQFSALSPTLQDMLRAYTDGVNTYLDSMALNPAKYQPSEFNSLTMERWSIYKSIAVMQFLTRVFGQAGGSELTRLNELQENGQAWFDENRPINDATAPTTIVGGSSAVATDWNYSGITVRKEAVEAFEDKRKALYENAIELGIPPKFGSFAVLISTTKSASGKVMLLGAPQMGEPQIDQTNIIHELELNCPTLHVGGMTVAGIPLVIIGHTDYHAWTLTSGMTDNSDIYIESTQDASFGKYLHNGQWLDFEGFQTTIDSLETQIPFTYYRTIHGPVVGSDLQQNQAFSLKMTFWNKELDMSESVYQMIKAKNLAEFEEAAKTFPFSFNLHYAGKDQKIKYWHVGLFQDRSDGVDPRLPHNGDGSEEWGGFIAFADLPQADYTQQDYFVNWNNKPVSWWNNGDNIPWAGSSSQTIRVGLMENFVGPLTSFGFDQLRDVPRQINSHGTYQQIVAFTEAGILDENIIPPGQSAFKDVNFQPSPNISDQWPLHQNWQFKDMEFGDAITSVDESDELIPSEFVLQQNYPNPFNPTTTISYQLANPGEVLLEIYNLRGQLITTLVNESQTAGRHQVQWDAQVLSSGVYVYKITSGEFISVRKGVLLK